MLTLFCCFGVPEITVGWWICLVLLRFSDEIFQIIPSCSGHFLPISSNLSLTAKLPFSMKLALAGFELFNSPTDNSHVFLLCLRSFEVNLLALVWAKMTVPKWGEGGVVSLSSHCFFLEVAELKIALHPQIPSKKNEGWKQMNQPYKKILAIDSKCCYSLDKSRNANSSKESGDKNRR